LDMLNQILAYQNLRCWQEILTSHLSRI